MTTSDIDTLRAQFIDSVRVLLVRTKDDPQQRLAVLSMICGETGLACYIGGLSREHAVAGIHGAYDAIEQSTVDVPHG